MEYIKKQLSEIGWCDEFKKLLTSNHVYYREDKESDLVILFNNYNDLFQSSINQTVRSMVISRDNRSIISYSCPTPLENSNGVNYLMRNLRNNKPIMTECYEGTFMSIFNYNDKWYMTTRKCLDARDSKFKSKNYYDMFEDIILKSGYSCFEDFCKKLNKCNSYYFILLDSDNINIVNYSYLFGDDYHKLVFTYERDSNQNILTDNTYSNCPTFIDENIIKPNIVSDIGYIDEYNKLNKWNLPAKSEGLILRFNNTLVKLQSLDYQFAKAIGFDENIYLGMLKMYQVDKLDDYINYNGNKEKFEKIVNPLNVGESFMTLGIINSVFRVLTTELYELYNKLYDKSGVILDSDLYKLIPVEYRYFIFKIRGINFKKLKNGKDMSEKDVYYLLKTTEIEYISSLIRMRKLMLNLCYINKFDNNVKKFRSASRSINKLNLKLINIYTNKLYPEIMDKDVPQSISLV